MALRGPRPLLFLTVVLLAAGLAKTIPLPDSYLKFVRDHIDFPKTRPPMNQSYCNYMMKRLNQMLGMCKITHSFIHAPASQVQNVCTTGGTCNQYNQCDSNVAYRVTTCRVRPRPRPPRCIYSGTSQVRRIRVSCRLQRPVRFIKVL